MQFRLGLAVLCATIFTLPVAAHHSHGNYVDEFSDMEGVVSEIHFVVPQSGTRDRARPPPVTSYLTPCSRFARGGISSHLQSRRTAVLHIGKEKSLRD